MILNNLISYGNVIFFGSCIFIIIFNLFSYLMYIVGNRGAGKTSLATYYALKFQYIKPIFANYRIKCNNFTLIEPVDLFDKMPNECLIILDEIQNIVEARRSSSEMNITIDDIFNQSRKTGFDIIGTSIFYKASDLRFREQAEYIIEAEIRFDEFDDFYYTYYYQNGSERLFSYPYTWMYKYIFPYFNTYETINNPYRAKREFEMLRQNPARLLEKSIEIYDDIKISLNGKLTHDLLSAVLFFHGYYKGYEPFVYLYAKHLLDKLIKKKKK